MKKIFLGLGAALLAIGCNNLGENEYEIKGTVDASMNGKQVYLQEPGDMGFTTLDTAVVENGTYIFKDTVGEIGLRFITLQDSQPGSMLDIVLEPGTIKIETNKDTLQNSKRSGTYNNEKLQEFYNTSKAITDERKAFADKNRQEYMKASEMNDTATVNRLNKQMEVFTKRSEDMFVKFVKDNPKAYIDLYFVQNLANPASLGKEEAKKLYDSLDESIKNTKLGKETGEKLAEEEISMEQLEKNKANSEIGKQAPAFSAKTPDGKTMSLKDAMGKVTIIDFWASWCGPCRAENPNVVKMYKELHPQGLNIIGVSLDKDEAKWKEAIAKDSLTWYHVSNLKQWKDPIAFNYGVDGIPAAFILDENGVIVAKNLRGEELKAKVKELLAK